ncbi:hypothetical protein CVT91_10070 [Candidatus Atribacteria bacterium HGW-Atribacteria-1]|nr:MAG: hypothetical protein CVT91_10070 [Candidatus Atribacteria bacterium HGW-Atribacteria-1]
MLSGNKRILLKIGILVIFWLISFNYINIQGVALGNTTSSIDPLGCENPFISKEIALLFQDNFEDGVAKNWELEPGWDIKSEKDNYILSGSGHRWARPHVSGWTDYTIEVDIKIIRGSLHFNIRHNTEGMFSRYFLGIHQSGLYLNKQIGEDFFDLIESSQPLKLRKWNKIKISVEGNNIKVYLNNTLKIDYNDDDIPIRLGGFAFETLDKSLVYFDNITVTGVKLVQKAKWVKTGGPIGGLGYDIRIHPQDKKIMFVTDNPSGVNKSYDGGNTWVQRNKGITVRSGSSGDGIPIFSLSIDPNNPNIVWAGIQGMRGIFKSTDGGESWVKKDNGITEWNEISFRNFGIHPRNSNIVFTGAQISTGILGKEFDKSKGKIYKTEDGGENWHCVWEGDSLVRFIIFDPTNPNIIYASTGIFDSEAYNDIGVGVLKSIDGGNTWKQINNGITNLFVGFLEMHPHNPRILFAAAGMNASDRKGGIYRTIDGGEHWEQVLSGPVFTAVTFSSSHPNVVYVGGECAFFRSDDGGNSWEEFTKPEGNYGPPGIRAGFPISAVVDPDDPMTIFVNNYGGGAFKSTDGARTWEISSKGYTGADLFWICLNPDNPDIVYTIGRTGPFRSFNGGQDWTGLQFGPANEAEWNTIAINPFNPKEIIIADEFTGHIYKSKDGGNKWITVFRPPYKVIGGTLNRHGFKAIAYAPSSPNIIYAGMRKGRRSIDGDLSPGPSFGMYKSTDGGNTWKEINSGLNTPLININCIVAHPTNSNIVYIGTWRDGIYKTTNGGESWEPINGGLVSLDIRSLAIDLKNPEVVYAGLGEGAGIFRTTNGGEYWEGINYGIQVECPSFLQRVGQVKSGVSLTKTKRLTGKDYYSIPWTSIKSIVIDPINSEIIYAADYSLGVYMSTDGGISWNTINDGLSTKAVSSMAISADGKILYAATSGEGVFRLDFGKSKISSGKFNQKAENEKINSLLDQLREKHEKSEDKN